MSRETHVRFWERAAVQLRRATRLIVFNERHFAARPFVLRACSISRTLERGCDFCVRQFSSNSSIHPSCSF